MRPNDKLCHRALWLTTLLTACATATKVSAFSVKPWGHDDPILSHAKTTLSRPKWGSLAKGDKTNQIPRTPLFSVTENGEEEVDWRDFRARLVLQQRQEEDQKDPVKITSEPLSEWAYDAGQVIETGSLVVSRPEPDFCMGGLRQQYFHKSVIIILEHNAENFTKGIILNRPTNLVLTDDDFTNNDGTALEDSNSNNRWPLWFGGDVLGMHTDEPEINCLHSLDSQAARDMSTPIVKDLQCTSFEGARRLVAKGLAQPSDFWIFCGYAGWNPRQLQDELERESWYMVAADSRTLWNQLYHQQKASAEGDDPREAGVHMWASIYNLMGKSSIEEKQDKFDDLMLREWAREWLMFKSEGGSNITTSSGSESPQKMFDDLIRMVSTTELGPTPVGTIVRAPASTVRSPYLLEDQQFHKSLVLITQDDEHFTIGVILNLPTTEKTKMTVMDNDPLNPGKKTKRSVIIPLRYGGPFGIKQRSEKPTMFLHNSQRLRDSNIGMPVNQDYDEDEDYGSSETGFWKCTREQVVQALQSDLALPYDFMAVSGFCVWEKVDGGMAGGMRGEIWGGNFEITDEEEVDSIWELLTAQSRLSNSTLDGNLRLSDSAWEAALNSPCAVPAEEKVVPSVYKSNTTIAELTDDARRIWIQRSFLHKQ